MVVYSVMNGRVLWIMCDTLARWFERLAVDVSRGDGTVRLYSLEDEVLPRCREDVE